MGCDIHSAAEVRDKETGEWEKVGPIFDYPWSSRTVEITEENIDRFDDGHLIDAVDFYIKSRADGKDYTGLDKFSLIEPGSDLEKKILLYSLSFSSKLNSYRDNREQLAKDFPVTDSKRHHDSWDLMRHSITTSIGEDVDLEDHERDLLKKVILAYHDDEESPGYRKLNVHFSKLSDGTWLPFYLDGLEKHDEPLDSRNYTLFAALSDVRNYNGGVEPMGEANGVPEDATAEFKELVERWGEDGHSHTHRTLADLKAYDLDGDVTYTGLVSETQMNAMKARGWPEDPYVSPGSWSGGIGGQGIRTFTPEGFERWAELGHPFINQPEKVSIFADDLHITPDMLPESLRDNRLAVFDAAPLFQSSKGNQGSTAVEAVEGKVDLWQKSGMTEEEADEQERRMAEEGSNYFLMREQRYSYNGIKPYIEVSFKQKRRDVLGDEFNSMVEAFEQIVQERGLTDEDVRLVAFYDN